MTYFSQFGEVVDAMVVYNHTMGVSRGFGFVTFKELEVAEAMVKMTHCINEKTVEAKLALPKGEHVAESLEEKMSKQIFVGGLPHNTTSDQLKEWAQRQFGPHNLANAIAVIDLKTKVTRGFGFIQFTTPEMVDYAVQAGLHYEMNSKKVTVKRAQAHHPTPCAPDMGADLMGMQQNVVPVSVYQELLAMGGY
jgi:RNA-binding protein Musashi